VQLGLEVEGFHKDLDKEVGDVLKTLIVGVGVLLLFKSRDGARIILLSQCI